MSKSPIPKAAAKKARSSRRKPSRKNVVSEKASITHRKKAPNVAAQKLRDTNRKAAAQFQEPAQVLELQCLQLQRGGALFVILALPKRKSRCLRSPGEVSITFTLKCQTRCVRSPNGT